MKRKSKQPAVSAIPASGYVDWLQALSRRYRQSQIKAAIAVNSEMLRFYFSLGADIVRMEKDQPWGSGFLKRLSSDLRKAMPDAQCFSVTNLKYMRGFFRLYAPCLIGHQVGGHLEKRTTDETMPAIGHQAGDRLPEASVFKLIFAVPWRHHIAIIDKFRTNPEAALFYVRQTVANGWSRSVLLNFLDTKLHERQGKALTNFASRLPESESDLAQEVTKDPYSFDFIALTPRYREQELKDALLANVERFLLELGQGFMLVGREYRLQIGAKEKFADLLFFHMNLNRYVVVEVKTTEFESEHLGQLGLYVSAVNHLLKKPSHEPTIGLLICKTKDNTMVKWALESTRQPVGVSEYRISDSLPSEIASDLPSIAEIESSLPAVSPAPKPKRKRKF